MFPKLLPVRTFGGKKKKPAVLSPYEIGRLGNWARECIYYKSLCLQNSTLLEKLKTFETILRILLWKIRCGGVCP